MRERTYRPPKPVQKNASRGLQLSKDHLQGGDPALENHAEKLASGSPLTVATIKSLYQVMVETQPHNGPDVGEPHAGTIDWTMCGGDEGLRWARKVLQQEQAIKSGPGATKIPPLVDFQFGPQTVALKVSDDKVDTQLQKAGIRSIVVPSGDQHLVFLNPQSISLAGSNLVSKQGRAPLGEPAKLPDADFSDPTVIEGSVTRIEVALKAVRGTAGQVNVDCYEFDPRHLKALSDCTLIGKLDIDEAYMLVSRDKIGYDAEVLKVDDGLGLVMGWAIISTIDGEPYFDKQGDHIPEETMLESAADFMKNSRVASDMHDGESHGRIIFAWPMTEEIAKSFGLETTTTGLMIAMKPDNDEVLEKFRNGDYTGFSIGGRRIEDEEVD